MTALARCEDLGDRLVVINANVGKRNALSEEYLSALRISLERANDDPAIRAVLLKGEGGYFCSGGDLQMLKGRLELSYEERQQKIDLLHNTIRAIVSCTKPVIAVVEGGAAGAGVSIALACDFVVASEQASFTLAYVKAGLVPDGGASYHLMQLLPRALLMRMAILAEPVSATRLHELGAISQVAHEDKVMAEAMALVDALSKGPQATQTAIKAMINQADENSLDDQLNYERDAMASALGSPEGVEGIQAFLGKRSPRFSNLGRADVIDGKLT